MSIYLKIIAIIIAIFLIIMISKSLKKGQISDKQSILWYCSAFLLIVLSLFPSLLKILADFLGIWWAPAILIFAVLIVFGFIIFSHTKLISTQRFQIAELAMQVSILLDKVNQYEEEIKSLKDTQNTK